MPQHDDRIEFSGIIEFKQRSGAGGAKMKRNARHALADHSKYPRQVGTNQMMRDTDRQPRRLLTKDIKRTAAGSDIGARGFQKAFACCRQTHAARSPFDQAMSQHVLKPAQTEGYCRLRCIHHACNLRERLQFGNEKKSLDGLGSNERMALITNCYR